jgi:DNA-binding NarL/FixJ family response regulator
MIRHEEPDLPWVVLVDDDPGVLAAIRRLLRGEPFQVLATSDPLEALGVLGDRNVRVLVTDQRMPRLNGTELLIWVQARFPQMPCVLLSAFADTALVVERKDLRIERLVSKPWHDEDLRNLIRELGGFGKQSREAARPCRIDCAGRSDYEVLSQILPELALAREDGREATIELEQLTKMEGPLARFLFSLVRLSAEQEVRVRLLEGSGLLRTALLAIGGRTALVTAETAGREAPPWGREE